MSLATTGRESFVIFPLGERRFALLTKDVVELSRTGFVQTFPHTSPGLAGVLVRRGEVLPVWDLGQTLVGSSKATLKYWLVTRRNFAADEWTAIPVSGECQMLLTEMLPPPEGSAPHVRGVLFLEEQPIVVLDLAHLAEPNGPAASQERDATIKEGNRL